VGAELHHRFGLSLSAIGGLLAAFGAGAFIYVAAAGTLVARLGQSGLAAVGAVLMAAGYVALAVTPTPWLAPFAIAVLGLGFYMLHNTLQTNATQMAPEARGLAVSLFAFTLFTSQSVGVAVAAPVMDHHGGRPIFLGAALILVAISLWFRRQLLRRPPT
jgi:MFS transporter, YNFM family, putative membrane transport protein